MPRYLNHQDVVRFRHPDIPDLHVQPLWTDRDDGSVSVDLTVPGLTIALWKFAISGQTVHVYNHAVRNAGEVKAHVIRPRLSERFVTVNTYGKRDEDKVAIDASTYLSLDQARDLRDQLVALDLGEKEEEEPSEYLLSSLSLLGA